MQKKLKSLFKGHWLVISFLIFYFLTIAYKLIVYNTPFYNWDESIYSQSGREMIAQKSLLVPLWQGQPWLDKPPLPLLVYGIALSIFPKEAEVATRIVTLMFSILTLLMIYILYEKVARDRIVALVTIVITAFIPTFLQRAQVLNVDVFLLFGWLGYMLFAANFRISLIFLLVGVLSKSLLGFYPVLLFITYSGYLFFRKKISREKLLADLKKRFTQIVIASIWFIIMIFQYGNDFINSHFYESHFKRISASIESHFGARTFYIDLLFIELGIFIWPSILGGIYILYQWLKKRDDKKTLLAFFFVPWFLLLNLTKTKIAWYIYPVVSQFAFLAAYSLEITKSRRTIKYVLAAAVIIFISLNNFKDGRFFKTLYSSEDDAYHIALAAKNKCRRLTYLVNPETRKANATLKSMNLTITSTEWWGDHPRVVYYFGKPVRFEYIKESFEKNIAFVECAVLSKEDIDEKILATADFVLEQEVGELALYIKRQ